MSRAPLGLIAGVCAFAVVVGARSAVRGPPPSPEPVARVAPRVAPDVPPAERPPAEVDPACAESHARVLDRLDALRAQVDPLVALGDALGGQPVPWPAEAPDAVREPAARARLEAAAERAGAALREIRCDEYPCVALLEVVSPLGVGAPSKELADALRAGDGEPGLHWPFGVWPGEAGGTLTAVALIAEEPDLALQWRMEHRVADHRAGILPR